MKSIEQLLKINRNKERYNLLKSELAANRLVIFLVQAYPWVEACQGNGKNHLKKYVKCYCQN